MTTIAKRQRIRVCLKAYDHQLIDLSAQKIVDTAKRTEQVYQALYLCRQNAEYTVFFVHLT